MPKKSANRSRTRNLVHNSPRVYPCAMGLQTLVMQVKVRKNVSVYIIWFCQTPCQCTWRLMTNRRCRSRRAAAPSHDIPRPARGWTWICLATCDVLPADRRSNQKETVTCQLPGYQWAIPSQRPTHLVVGTPGRPP